MDRLCINLQQNMEVAAKIHPDGTVAACAELKRIEGEPESFAHRQGFVSAVVTPAAKRKRGGDVALEMRKEYNRVSSTLNSKERLTFFIQMCDERKRLGETIVDKDRSFLSRTGDKYIRCFHDCCDGDFEQWVEAYPEWNHSNWKCKWLVKHLHK
jgi:hypothetical protein